MASIARRWRLYCLLSAAAIFAVAGMACGSSDGSDPTTAPTSEPTQASPATNPATNAVTATAVTSSGPDGVRHEPSAKSGGILRIPGRSPAHFDLHQSPTVGNLHPQANMYDSLIRFDPIDGGRTIIPDLAVSWEVRDDGLAYTFQLRDGVKFHDGAPLTADDVVATFNKIIFPPVGIISVREAMFKSVERVEAVDPLTVRFVLREPNAVFLPALGISFNAIVREKTLEDNGSDLRRIVDYPGTGPFRFKQYISGELWEVEANPDYWNEGLPYLDGIYMPVMAAAANRDAAIRTGQVDYVSNAGQDIKDWAESTGTVNTVEHISFSALDITFNMGREPWNDRKVRQAIHLVIDRDAVNDTIRQLSPWDIGYWLRVDGKWAPSVADVKQLEGYGSTTQANLDEAKRLMAEAGYADGIGEIDLLCRGTGGDKWADYLCPAVADQLRALNIDVRIRPIQSSSYFEDAQRGNFDLAMGARTSAIDDPSDPWANWFTTGGGQNYGRYSNPEFDDLVHSLTTTLDEQERRVLVAEGIEILENDMPAIVHAWEMWRPAWYPYVKGANFDRVGIYTVYRWDTVWFDK